MPAISVIVPVYHVEKYLPRCIHSILAQTFTDFELILVDDGSPDNCGAICDEYAEKDKRIRVIHKENGGVSSARNAGLDLAEGDYITFVDSDDYIGKDRLERLYDSAQASMADNVCAGYTIPDDVAEDKTKYVEEFVYDIKDNEDRIRFIINEILTRKLGWEVWTRLFRSDIIKQNKICFCETCGNYAEDLCFTLEYALYCDRFAAIDNAEYYYCQRQFSMMDKSLDELKFNEMNEVSKQFASRFYRLHGGKEAELKIPIFFFLIQYPEYLKLVRNKQVGQWKNVSRAILDKEWFRRNTASILTRRKEISRFLDPVKTREAWLFSLFSTFHIWPLYLCLLEFKAKVKH